VPGVRVGVLWLVSILVFFGGCGDTVNLRAPTSRAFVSKVERLCTVAYKQPSPKGEALGFVCGGTKDKRVDFGAVFTRRVGCSLFLTLVDSGGYRDQGCVGKVPSVATGRAFCRGDKITIWARVLPRAKMASVKLSTGLTAGAKILSLNATTQAQWGGTYFDVLNTRKPVSAMFIERDGHGRVVGRSTLFLAGPCSKYRPAETPEERAVQ
jgi:hypothetical protein